MNPNPNLNPIPIPISIPTIEILMWVATVCVVLLLLIIALMWQRISIWNRNADEQLRHSLMQILNEFDQGTLKINQQQENHHLQQREFSNELAYQQRDELSKSLFNVQTLLNTQLKDVRESYNSQTQQSRDALLNQLSQTTSQLIQQLQHLSTSTNENLENIRNNVETRLQNMETSNTKKLEEMRHTVDEKLQATLQARLGESFKQVSDRLEQVHRGLGEMQQLAQGVGDLKRVLTNVKSRGTWGEMQLANVLDNIMTTDMYDKNVETIPGSGCRVEFAIKLPGQSETEHIWLPIDAKFPKEQFERIEQAIEAGNIDALSQARNDLIRQIKQEAKTIREKYVAPPNTTDFAILFLPTESLYGEVARHPGVLDALQTDHRVVIAGPSTLMAILSSLHMGFRTLAMEKRATEVWQVLGAVKTEFTKFGDVLIRAKDRLEKTAKELDSAQVRTRQMNRALTSVEQLEDDRAKRIFDLLAPEGEGQEGQEGNNHGQL